MLSFGLKRIALILGVALIGCSQRPEPKALVIPDPEVLPADFEESTDESIDTIYASEIDECIAAYQDLDSNGYLIKWLSNYYDSESENPIICIFEIVGIKEVDKDS